MKIEKEVREWVDDYVPDYVKAKELSGAINHLIAKYFSGKERKAFARGLIVGMIVIILILKWLS